MTIKVAALSIELHERQVGVLVRYQSNVTQLVFAPEYVAAANRSTFTGAQLLVGSEYFNSRFRHSTRVTPVLANLLPEGSIRDYYIANLKTHVDDDFALLTALGNDLPGAIVARPIQTVPDWAIDPASPIEEVEVEDYVSELKFSLAGVQMKFSSERVDGRFNIGTDSGWIIKTPSTRHPHVPENEFSMMQLATIAGINTPKFELIELGDISNLPDIPLPSEQKVYAIKRFDRADVGRVHMEDFAQVFGQYPAAKYQKINYEQIGRFLFEYSKDPLGDVQEMAARLLVNILIGNADAHVKNWSVLYRDQVNPELSPAYDIVSTLPYIPGDTKSALNMGKEKEWDQITLATFNYWAERIGVRPIVILKRLTDVLATADSTWLKVLKHLPVEERQRRIIQDHIKKRIRQFR